MRPSEAKPAPEADWTVLTMIRWATGYFAERDVPSPRLSIEWLLAELLGVKRLMLYVMHDRPLRASELVTLRGWVRRRAAHEPLQYITGKTDFMKAVISVTPAVLIPRPETEELVERILGEHGVGTHRRVIDLGTGSGCIAIALKMARPEWQVTGVDVSPDALRVARGNAEANGAEADWILGDFFRDEQLPEGPFDIVVSNPPYIRPEERTGMDKQVKDFEPEIALFHENPLLVYSRLTDWSARHLGPTGEFWAELNEGIDPLPGLTLERRWRAGVEADSAGKARFLKMWITC